MQSIILQKITRFGAIMALIACFSTNISAQTDVKIGTNPGNKTASAVLELESTTKGFLLPRMTAAQMGTIATPANGLAIYNTDASCVFIYRNTSWVSLCDSASNGLTKAGGLISLGGALTGATTITATAVNTLGISGLQGGIGTVTDSIVTVDPASGVLRRRSVTDIVNSGGTAWLLGGNTVAANQTVGTNNAFDFGIETNGTTRLTVTSAGAITQAAGGGQVTLTGNVDATNGLDVTGAALTANAGSTLTGTTDINTTGAGATNIGNATSATSITGATSINTTGALGTSIGNATSTTTVLGATNINATGAATTTIGNSGAVANIAGSTIGVTGVTNINTTGAAATVIGNAASTTTLTGPSVNITNLNGGASTDSLVTVNGAGILKKRTVADVVGGAITADNGLTKNTTTNVRLGGTLAVPTNIAQAGNIMTFTGGNFGVGAAAPNSTLQVTGSQAVSYTKVTSATTLDATHYIVLANATGGAITLTLPSAATNTGRTYYIGKSDESANAVTFSPAIYLTETTTVASINYAKKFKIVSDGTNWWIYNE